MTPYLVFFYFNIFVVSLQFNNTTIRISTISEIIRAYIPMLQKHKIDRVISLKTIPIVVVRITILVLLKAVNTIDRGASK